MSGRELIRETRLAQNLSREALAKKAGISATGLYKIESGEVALTKAAFGTIEAIANSLGISLDSIATAEKSNPRHDARYETFIENIWKLPEQDRLALARAKSGIMENADGKATSAFYSVLPSDEETRKHAERWFAVATWAAAEPPSAEPSEDPKTPHNNEKSQPHALAYLVGVAARPAGTERMSDNYILRRLQHVLDVPLWDNGDDPAHTQVTGMGKLVRTARDAGRVDYAALLYDMDTWDDRQQTIGDLWTAQALSGLRGELIPAARLSG